MKSSIDFAETRLRLQESLKLMISLEENLNGHKDNLKAYIKVLEKISLQTEDLVTILEMMKIEAKEYDI